VKVLIVDDEPPARERLRQILADIDGYDVAGLAANGEEALQMVSASRPDIILLDIRMPGMDGIETARYLNKLENPPAVVFTTAFDQYAIDAFDARAIGYVLKPVRRSRLEGALGQAARLAGASLQALGDARDVAAKRRHVCSSSRDRLTLIDIDDIHYFEADQKYVAVHHEEGISLIDDSLKSLEEEFAEDFVRIHRSVLVAVARIESLERTDDGRLGVELRGGSHRDDKPLIISRRHVAEVRRRLKGIDQGGR
jgi:two-component system, LytTR family, response regulator AlgR